VRKAYQANSSSFPRNAIILLALAVLSNVCSLAIEANKPTSQDIPLDPVPVVNHNSVLRSGNNLYYGHSKYESGYIAILCGTLETVDVSALSVIAWAYGSRVVRYEIRLAPDWNGPFRVVKELDWYDYDLPLDGIPHYTTDVTIEDTDTYYWVTAVMEPDPDWHEDYKWAIPAG
jgi:hypothetical protein